MRLVALLVVALAVLGTPAAASEPAERPSAVVLGDSLAVGTFPHLAVLLPDWALTRHAAVGLRTAAGARFVRSLGSRLPRHLLLSLGTNDDPGRVAEFRRELRSVLAAAGTGRCVVWTTIARPPVDGVSYEAFNRVLVQEAGLNGRLRIVDWRAMTRAHPEWLRRDRVHATADGYRARAAATVRALGRCGPP